MAEFDFSARYTVDGNAGIAFRATGFEMVRDEDFEWTGIEERNPERVHAVMVGDDHVWTFDVSDLTLIGEDDYCSCCGQIGCPW